MTNEKELMAGHLVLDIETLGIKKGCAILSIGAVCGENSFYAVISPVVGSVEKSTLDWWHSDKVSSDARTEVFVHSFKKYTLKEALCDFLAFIEVNQPHSFWGNSPEFDFGHIEYWLKYFELEVPWDYWQLRDIRTIKDFVSAGDLDAINAKRYIPHIALEDARKERDILAAFLIRYEVKSE